MLKKKHTNDWIKYINLDNNISIDSGLKKYCVEHCKNLSVFSFYYGYYNHEITQLLIRNGFRFCKYKDMIDNNEFYDQVFYMKNVLAYIDWVRDSISIYFIDRNDGEEICTKIKQEIKDIETMQKVLS